jgi:hypothetical protein
MARAWKELCRHLSADRSMERFWSEIRYAIHSSKAPVPSRSKLRDQYVSVVKKAKVLQALIEDTDLDVAAWKFFPEEVMQIIGARNWGEMDQWGRQEFAYSTLREWPLLIEILSELQKRAELLAHAAMTDKRLVSRESGKENAQILAFVRHLHDYLHTVTGQNLNAVVAHITNTIFYSDLDNRKVRKMLERTP